MNNEERQELQKRATIACLDTVGYREAEDKAAYKSAVHTAVFCTLEVVQPIMDSLLKSLRSAQGLVDYHRGNLETVANIFEEYKEETD